ncbi:MAG: hypothetical protein LC748_15575 [Thermomicrobia bacterium]|nr:hypothetical protein [Thermomicrobia bacterium]
MAYADATGAPEVAPPAREGLLWTYAKDYIALRLAGRGPEIAAYLPEEVWAALFAGDSEQVVDAVIDADDPFPAARMMTNLFNPTPYFCAC